MNALPFLLPARLPADGEGKMPPFWTCTSWDGSGFGYVAYERPGHHGAFILANKLGADPELVERHDRWMKGRPITLLCSGK